MKKPRKKRGGTPGNGYRVVVTEPSPNQGRMLSYIASHIQEYGYQPSYEEIADHFGWASKGYVHQCVALLERKGVVEGQRGARAIHFNWREYL